MRTVLLGGFEIISRMKNGAAMAARAVCCKKARRLEGIWVSIEHCVMIYRMKHVLLLAAVFALHAQTPAPAPDGVPAPSNVRGAQQPRLLSDRRVVFQLKAPTAQKVQVMPGGGSNGMGKGPFDMTKADDGTWSATIGPVAPGFHYYWFLVDGVPANDPAGETYFGWAKQSSALEVPDPALDFYD